MFIGLDETGKKTDIRIALKNKEATYYCPLCNGKLRIKDGNVNVSHFAHISIEDCDTFSSDMSEWHMEWQEQFPLENREVVLDYEGEKHRADVCFGRYVVEFQYSKISNEEFDERNSFYTALGYKVVWIFDVRDEWNTDRMECYDEWHRYNDNGGKWSWKYAWRFMKDWIPQSDKKIIVFFQGADSLFESEEESYMERVTWAIEEYGESNFKRFFTSYYPGNSIELIDYLKNNKL